MQMEIHVSDEDAVIITGVMFQINLSVECAEQSGLSLMFINLRIV